MVDGAQISIRAAKTDLRRFREQISAARRQAGYLQKDLAAAVGLEPHTLSHKLHGSDGAILSHQEVKQIIKALAAWHAISSCAEAIELLTCMGLKPESFSPDEWSALSLEGTVQAISDVPAFAAPARRRHFTLPTPLTSFIGRERLVQFVCERLRCAEVRLLTLPGPGGVGKTRLALEVARLLERDFSDGVCFVPLAALHDARLVLFTIAQALGLPDAPLEQAHESGTQQLRHFLREKQLLLVLDNFEHLLDASSLVADLLQWAPRVKMLVTSRSILHLYGEHLQMVPPLDLADPDTATNPDQIAQAPAVRLFVERARAVQPSFALTKQNAVAVAKICAHLDGLPLALELAAARARFFSPSQLLKRLGKGVAYSPKRSARGMFPLLGQSWRNLPERQHTLEKTIDWGYQLLEPGVQQLFVRLGVFADGWTEEAMQAITASKEEAGDAVLARLEVLVNQSFVTHRFSSSPESEAEIPRFYMLEMIREYALERLQQSEEWTAIRWKHARYYMVQVEKAGTALTQAPHMLKAIQYLKQEQENIRVALAFIIEQQAAEMALHFCKALAPLWERHRQFDEGRYWIAATFSLQEAFPAQTRAPLVLVQGKFAWWEGNYTQAQDLFEESLRLYQALSEVAGQAEATFFLAETYYQQGKWPQATAYYESSLQLYIELDDTIGMGNVLSGLGGAALFQGYLDVAHLRLCESLELLRISQHPLELYGVLGLLSVLEATQNRPIAALSYVQEALVLFQATGLDVFPQEDIATVLSACSSLLGTIGETTAAAQIGGSAEALFEHLGTGLSPLYLPLYQASLEKNKARIDKEIWAKCWEDGRKLSRENVITLAIRTNYTVLTQNERKHQYSD
jgi:predicted ATPase